MYLKMKERTEGYLYVNRYIYKTFNIYKNETAYNILPKRHKRISGHTKFYNIFKTSGLQQHAFEKI